MVAALDLFDALLERREWLLGDRIGVADLTVFPFVKQAALPLAPDDDERFHAVLAEFQPIGDRAALRAWIERVDALPRGL